MKDHFDLLLLSRQLDDLKPLSDKLDLINCNTEKCEKLTNYSILVFRVTLKGTYTLTSACRYLNTPVNSLLIRVFRHISHTTISYLILEPGAAGWKVQTNPLSYGGNPYLYTYLGAVLF